MPKNTDTMDLEYAEGWRPNEGDTIIGEVVEIGKGWSDQSDSHYPIITIKPQDGGDPVAVHCFHTTLYGRLLDLRPKVGERIGIKYQGKDKTKDGKREVAKYVVKMDRGADANAIWDSLDSPNAPKGGDSATPATDDDIPF